MAKISYHNFTILCHVDFTIFSEQCSQNNFPIQRQILSRLQNIKKYGGYLDQSGGR